MSRLTRVFFVLCLSVPSCRSADRGPAGDDPSGPPSGKVTRARPAAPLEVFPRVIEEPQPVADAVLAQPETAACLADARELRDPNFVVELSGAITATGKVTGSRAGGVTQPIARCLERALSDLVLLPGQPGPFRLTLARQAGADGGGAGVIVEPGVGRATGKKFE